MAETTLGTGHRDYRPDIDGLRAIAIVSVVLFHLDRRLLSGGFVGVDVFFVISGFLITGNILDSIAKGTFSAATFWQRRISRLLPSMLLVAFATLSLSYFVYDSQDFASAGINAFAAISSMMNFKLWKQGSYFTLSPDAQPFLHFWSLSVEEQYYLLYPLILLLLAKFGRKQLTVGMIALPVLSLVACLMLVRSAPVAAFYLLPSRAWELGIGGLIALWRSRIAAAGGTNGLTRSVGLAGFGLIALACVLIDETSEFPSLLTIIPVAGSALIVIATIRQNYVGQSILGSRLMSYVGRNSYVLYLWHWPAFSLLDYTLWHSDPFLRVSLKIGVSLALTFATHHLIEGPLRERLNRAEMRKTAFGLLAASILAFGTAGYFIRSNFYIDVSPAAAKSGGRVFPGKPGGETVLLLGDSNASMYAVSLREACRKLGCRLVVGSSAAGDSMARTDRQDSEIWKASVDLAKSAKPDLLVYVDAWDLKLSGDPGRLRLALDQLVPHAKRIVLITEPPHLPKGAGRAAVRNGATLPFREEVDVARSRAKANEVVRSEGHRVMVVDSVPFFDLGNRGVRYTGDGNAIYYQDSEHLSKVGADIVVGNLIEPLIQKTKTGSTIMGH